jgi:ribosome-interacting GTPase 1
MARFPNSIVISVHMKLNLDVLLEKMWEYLGLVRVYTKKPGSPPDFEEPVVLTNGRHGFTVEAICLQVCAVPTVSLL